MRVTRTSCCSTRTPRRSRARVSWDQPCSPTSSGTPDRRSNADSAPYVPRSVVVNPYFDWNLDRPPRIPYHETVIYEAHVRGLTMEHPVIPDEQRGTYLGLAHPAVISHLKGLGVTAVELMPVHQFVTDSHLNEKGLGNYWGYNTIGFFAPHNGYSASGSRGQQVQEFKTMVRALHEAGIEVILDVVYNHTAEGNHLGPTLSFRGIDNAAYYRLVDDDRRYYMDYTGYREQPAHAAPARAPDDHGLAALLGARHARGRLQVRPGRQRSPASSTRWTGCPRSSTWSSRTRWSPR